VSDSDLFLTGGLKTLVAYARRERDAGILSIYTVYLHRKVRKLRYTMPRDRETISQIICRAKINSALSRLEQIS